MAEDKKIKIRVRTVPDEEKASSGRPSGQQMEGTEYHRHESERLIRLDELAKRHRRNPFLHWAAFILSLVSLGMGVTYVSNFLLQPISIWMMIDIAINAAFFLEFFSRSGFRWNPVRYSLYRYFDFIAMVPILALAGYGVHLALPWIWLIVAARIIRTIDRLLGDGFFQRNALVLIEAFEEEITDRVLLRILGRIETDLKQNSFTHPIAAVMRKNKSSVMDRVKSETQLTGVAGSIAQLTGLETVIQKAEERVYDSAVSIVDSDEVDTAVRQVINSAFATMRADIENKEWKKHIGFHRGDTGN